MADAQNHQQKEEQMPPMDEIDESPPAPPREITKHHKIIKGGVGYLLANRYDASHKPKKFPSSQNQ